MMVNYPKGTTPGGNLTRKSSVTDGDVTGRSYSGVPGTTCKMKTGTNLKIKKKYFLGTLNVNSMLKTGKLKQLTKVLDEMKIQVLALQETRFTDEDVMDSGEYRIFKGKKGWNPAGKGIPHLGTAFAVDKSILGAVTKFHSPNERLSLLNIRCANKIYTLINCHAPINEDNRKNPEKVEKFWEELENEMIKIPDKNIKILIGDFNGQIGKEKKYRKIVGEYPAHKRTNRNGLRLIEICQSFNLKLMSTNFKKLPKKQKTWRSPNPVLGEFQIDHVAIAYNNQKEIMNVKVRKGANIETDHYLTTIKIRFIPQTVRRNYRKRIIRFDPEQLKHNKKEFQTKLNINSTDWDDIKKGLVSAASETAVVRRTKKQTWWNQACEESLEKRIRSWNKWHSSKKNEDYIAFKNQRSLTSKIIRATKRQYEREQLVQIEENFQRNNTRSFYRTFKRNIQKYEPQSLCFKDSTGMLVLNDKDNCTILAKYFEQLLNCEQPPERFEKISSRQNLKRSEPPEVGEIREIIKNLKNNRAPGEDGIIAEIWKNATDDAIVKLQNLIREIWESEEIPSDWKTAIIHPLYKKGDRTDCNNYRGISLLPVTYKILSKALQNRLENQIDGELGEYQAGFRKGRSCIEQIWNLKLIIKYRKMRAKNFFVTFVDFKKAYDSVDRKTLFNTLEEFGVDSKLIALIKQTLSDTRSKVKFRGEISQMFKIETGVRQGDGLSPLLFNCVLEKIIREWRKKLDEKGITKIKIGRKKDNIDADCIAFADDLAILSENIDDAIEQINILKEVSEKAGLKISFEKTKYMTNVKNSPRSMITKYGRINKVNIFKYLGEFIQTNALDKTANRERTRKMELAFQLTRNIYNKKSMSIKAKLRHYNVVIKPEGLYASECLAMNVNKELEQMKLKERKIIRKILGPRCDQEIWKKRSNKEIYGHIEDIIITMKKRRLSYYGHLKRMEMGRLTRRIFEYFDKNPRTQIAWFREVKKDLEQINVTEEDILNRSWFRNKVNTFQSFEEKVKKKTGAQWTDERKQKHSEVMKKYWSERKRNKQPS